MSTKEKRGRMGRRGHGGEEGDMEGKRAKEDNYTKLRREEETEGKEKRYMDTTLYSTHPANIDTSRP